MRELANPNMAEMILNEWKTHVRDETEKQTCGGPPDRPATGDIRDWSGKTVTVEHL